MRWAGLLACVVATTAAASPRVSNPAFLGIEMRNPGTPDPCVISRAIAGGPAEVAGLRRGDIVLAFDGAPVASCAVLLDLITSRVPGDVVSLAIQRATSATVVKVELSTRNALLSRVIGRPVGETRLVSVEDGAVYDLSALRGQMAIVGLYNPACVSCAPLFGKLAAWARERGRRGGPPPLVLAVVGDDARADLAATQRALEVPVVRDEHRDGEGSLFQRDLLLSDRDRLGMLVIDLRGEVQYLGPIAPDSDDAEAVLDELLAVAELASRRGK